MKWYVPLIVLGIYLALINVFGSYTITYRSNYRPSYASGYGTEESIGAYHSVTVEVRRARMAFGVMPTSVYVPIPFLGWKEYRIRYLNYFVVASCVVASAYLFFRKEEDYGYDLYEELMTRLQ